jgi:O-methyltransferase
MVHCPPGAAVPAHGRIVACELEEKWPEIGRPHWQAAGVADQIDLRIGAASSTLAGMHSRHGSQIQRRRPMI